MGYEDSVTLIKSKAFAVRCVRLYQELIKNRSEYVMAKQLLRSGTSIGANVKEAQYAQSVADFRSKLNIALKEAAETEYWLELLHDTDYVSTAEFESIHPDCVALLKLLTSILKSTDPHRK